jgi:hypothetical protein
MGVAVSADRGHANACVTTIVLALGLALTGATHAQERAFQFGVIGDMPYTKPQEEEFSRVVRALDAADLAFVVHVGDFQADPRIYNRAAATTTMPCTDENYKTMLDAFNGMKHPFVVTPGDNDWTDCHHLQARKTDPAEALAKVRATFFPDGKSLGRRTIDVDSQSKDPKYGKFRENLRWSMGSVVFVTLHIVGSNDNLGRSPEMDAEQRERKAANLAWLRAAFAKAKSDNSRGLVIMTQANPGFENFWPPDAKSRYFGPFLGRGKPPEKPASAFDDYVAALAEEVAGFDRPVAYLHGDTHLFRIDKPLYSTKTNRLFENFTRVETFGWPDSHWVLATVDPMDAGLFRFAPQVVPGNEASRRGN